MKFPIALQPYTIRDEIAKDFLGAFTRTAEIGYQGVEIGAPPEGITVSEMKAHFQQIKLQVIGCHAGLDQLTNGIDGLLEYLQELDGSYAVLSRRFRSKEDVLQSAQLFNRIGENCRKQGVQFLYHNHDWEFVRFDGRYALDLLLEATDPELVQMELDTYWVKKGGEDPVEYLRKLKNRCPLLHIKDMEPGEDQFFAEVGEGILNFHNIVKAATEVGVKWLVVEQDHCRRPAFDCIETSYSNLKAMGVI